MKKLIRLTVLVLAILICLSSCERNKQSNEVNPTSSEENVSSYNLDDVADYLQETDERIQNGEIDFKKLGQETKTQLDAAGEKIVAYLNDEPIYEREVILSIPLDFDNVIDESDKEYRRAIIEKIAKYRLMDEYLKDNGIIVTREEAAERLKKSRDNIKQLAENGNEDRKNALKADEEYFAGLGMTEDEYMEQIGIQQELNSMISDRFSTIFYEQEMKKIQDDPNYKIRDIDEFLNELLEKADLVIVED